MEWYRHKISGTKRKDPTSVSVEGDSSPGQGITATTVNQTPFALTSGQANSKVFIYYNSGTRVKLFNYTSNKPPKLLIENQSE